MLQFSDTTNYYQQKKNKRNNFIQKIKLLQDEIINKKSGLNKMDFIDFTQNLSNNDFENLINEKIDIIFVDDICDKINPNEIIIIMEITKCTIFNAIQLYAENKFDLIDTLLTT